MPKKVLLSAGEISGDFQGANLVRALRKIRPEWELMGIGGDRMAAAGVNLLADYTHRGVVGLTEVLRHFPAYFRLYFRIKKLLKIKSPDLVILIDNQGFNMMLAKAAKKLGIPTIYYIAPQEWLWGKTKNLLNVAATINKILAIFPDEAEIYRQAGANVTYVGNPIVDLIPKFLEKQSVSEIQKELGLTGDKKYISILAGSRLQEISHVAPILIGAAALIHKTNPEYEFLIPVVDNHYLPVIESVVKKTGLSARVFVGRSHQAIKLSELVLATSGTVTLETAILLKPMIIVYRLSYITEFVGRKILGINLPFIGLPNLIAGEAVVPEIIQKQAIPAVVAVRAREILNSPDLQKKIISGLEKVKSKVGPSGAAERAAQEIVSFAG